ncbi:Putative Magnesium-dependent phosphatase-1 [Rhizopus microsporus]|nr:Putative Magnesium-dependent phosphatase-1 [Rhizopus microsporus]
MEIYPSSKIQHFKALSEKSNIACEEMLFFDDESRNREVSKLGVHFIHVNSRTGITPTQFENALQAFEKNAGRKQTSMHDYLNKNIVQPLLKNYIQLPLSFHFCVMSEHQAHELLLQAEKKLNSWTWFNKKNKNEDAAEMYEKAANTFKLAQRWKEAGDAYLKAAELYKTSQESKFECSKAYENASKCLKRVDAQAAIDALNKAILVDKEACSFRNAAKHHQEIAEIYETEIIDLKGARENWQEAAKLYMADDSRPMINKCILKVAHFDAQLEEYNAAIEHFEQVATDSIDNPLTKWSNKEFYLKAGLCSLCTNDTIKTHELLAKYSAVDSSFETTREYQFLSGILECVENNDQELFTQKVREFDLLTKLDNWKISILLKIKKTMDSNK